MYLGVVPSATWGWGEECVGREQRLTRGHIFMVVGERPPW